MKYLLEDQQCALLAVTLSSSCAGPRSAAAGRNVVWLWSLQGWLGLPMLDAEAIWVVACPDLHLQSFTSWIFLIAPKMHHMIPLFLSTGNSTCLSLYFVPLFGILFCFLSLPQPSLADLPGFP